MCSEHPVTLIWRQLLCASVCAEANNPCPSSPVPEEPNPSFRLEMRHAFCVHLSSMSSSDVHPTVSDPFPAPLPPSLRPAPPPPCLTTWHVPLGRSRSYRVPLHHLHTLLSFAPPPPNQPYVCVLGVYAHACTCPCACARTSHALFLPPPPDLHSSFRPPSPHLHLRPFYPRLYPSPFRLAALTRIVRI